VELRAMRAQDVPEVVALINRSYRHEGVPMAKHEEEFVDELAADAVSYEDDVRVAIVDGRITGWAHTQLLPSEVREVRCYVFGEVDPAQLGRGIGSTLLAWSARRGREQLLALDTTLPRYLRADAYDFQPARDALIRDHGFVPVRWFEELLRPLTDLPRLGPVTGIRLDPWPAPDGDAEVLATRTAAFADHWGSTPLSEQAWQFHVRGFGARPDLSLVARDEESGRLAGFCLNHRYEEDDEVVGRRDGWIGTLGTRREYRGRGIATALLTRSLELFAAAGLSHAMISVDGDSPTGAGRLYRSVGFERQHGSVVYQQVV
jgi:ribosomal protein S18 acetylase RimI-like enzyme